MIHEISETDLMLVPGSWPFAEQHKREIETHWAKNLRENPDLWNGKLLIARTPKIDNGILSAQCVEVEYAAYLAWREWGYPDMSRFNIFGTALVRSREGHLLYGVMGDRTSWPGRTYPPAGSLELEEVGPDGRLDAFASGARELKEETGIDVTVLQAEQTLVSWAGQQIAVVKVYNVDLASDELDAQINDFIAAQSNSELAKIMMAARVADLDSKNTEPYAMQIAQYLLP